MMSVTAVIDGRSWSRVNFDLRSGPDLFRIGSCSQNIPFTNHSVITVTKKMITR
jgi:hypothetical protein